MGKMNKIHFQTNVKISEMHNNKATNTRVCKVICIDLTKLVGLRKFLNKSGSDDTQNIFICNF